MVMLSERNSMQRVVLTIVSSALLMLPLTGCSSSSDANPSRDGNDAAQVNLARNTPPIHIEQTVILLDDGQPKVERGYRRMLADCLKAPWPVKPLEEDVAKKLGRTFLEIWYEGTRMAVKTDEWDYTVSEAPALCEFKAIHESKLTVTAPGKALDVDMIQKTGTRQSSAGVVRYSEPMSTGDDDELRAAVAAELQKHGQGDLLEKDLGEANEAGQPCKRVSDPVVGESCIWSGGRSWGFVTDQPVSSTYASEDTILLRREPPAGSGEQWSTQKMTVGKSFRDNAFAEPSSINWKDTD